MISDLVTGLANVIAPGLSDVQTEAAAAQQQLTLAFQVLIAEGAVACILLLAIVFVLTRKS
jgi:hypothetical protein